MHHMTHFVNDDARDIVRIASLLQQPVEEIDFSARQCGASAAEANTTVRNAAST